MSRPYVLERQPTSWTENNFGAVPIRRLAIDLLPLRPILDAAPQLYVAVRSTSGPHVTPELFGVSGERVICLTAASTLKVGRARRELR